MNADMSGSAQASNAYAAIPNDEVSSETSSIELRDVINFLRRRVVVISATTLGVFVAALMVMTQLTPRYEATATVLLDVRGAQVVDIDAVMSGFGTGAATANAQTAILKSYAIAERVANRMNLWSDPEFVAQTSSSVLSKLNPLNWFGNDPIVVDDGERARRRQYVIQTLRSRMQVSPHMQTQTIEISFESEQPKRAAEIANAIAEEYALDQLEAKFEATKTAAEWLSRRLEGMRSSLNAAERAVETFRSKSNLINADGLLLSEQELSELNSQLILIRAEQAEKQAIYARAQQLLSRGASLESVSQVIESPVIAALRQQQAELSRKHADFASRYGARHPQMINVRAERRDLEAQIQQEVSRIVDSLKNAVAVVRTREQSIEQSLADRRSFASENNQALVQLRALEREAEATRTLYGTFLARFKEVNEQETLQTSGVRIISPAIAPVAPSFPKTNLILLGALVLGLGLGGGIALAQELFDDTFHTVKQIEQVLSVPNIGVVPYLDAEISGDALPEYVLRKPLSPYSEAFRALRTTLKLSNVDSPPKVILFTSALPSEGKTTVATSFALAAAKAGIRTIIVDADIRKPQVHQRLGLGKVDSGLVEYLADPTSLDTVVRKHEMSGADFIPIAAGSINPTEVLGSQHMIDLLGTLRSRYDLVVIDSAPLLPVAETRVIANLADTTVLVVRWGQTPRAASLIAVKLLRQSGQHLAGAILSAVDMDRQASYGYGDVAYTYGNYGGYYSG
ncbi:MAG: capsular biosynthesis protein [Rhodobiaceae bacterium]|nr:MAG: capsular biosynthesis protein [Rhodobiaceae bacterium]